MKKKSQKKVPVKVKGEQHSGEVHVESKKEFLEVCKSLTTDFKGLIRLWGEVHTQSFSAGLFVENGIVVGASLEHLDKAKIIYGDGALTHIKSKFSGIEGHLDLYLLEPEDFEKALEQNPETLLEDPIKLTSLDIRIKSLVKAKTSKEAKKESKGFFGKIGGMFSSNKGKKLDRQKELEEKRQKEIQKINVGSKFSIVNFARDIKHLDPTKAKRFSALRARQKKKGISPEDKGDVYVDVMKQERFKKLRAKQIKLNLAAMKDVFKETPRRQPSIRHKKNAEHLEKVEKEKSANPNQEREKLKKELELLEKKFKEGQIPKDMYERISGNLQEKIDAIPKGPPSPPIKRRTGEQIETTIDKLYKYVNDKGEAKITESLAKKLKIPKSQIEEWAMILEEHELLEVHYPTIGEPIIRSKSEK